MGSSPLIGNFERPVLPIADPQSFSAVRSVIESSFSSARVAEFLKSLSRQGIRVRHFETVLGKGLLGEKTKTEYAKLGSADQGQIRELYLASLELVAPELREKFFKLYAYY
jgi:hypothetical protein